MSPHDISGPKLMMRETDYFYKLAMERSAELQGKPVAEPDRYEELRLAVSEYLLAGEAVKKARHRLVELVNPTP
jgi:hypothetical protein